MPGSCSSCARHTRLRCAARAPDVARRLGNANLEVLAWRSCEDTGLEHALENKAGDFIFIAPGIPHEVFNLSGAEPVVAIVARSDASEWEHIVPFERPL